MRFVVRLLPVLLAAAPAPALAEILDIRAEQSETDVRILFVFDAQPDGASVTVSGTEAQATIAGAHGDGRLLRPETSGLRQISVADRPLGLSVGAVAQRPILSAEASVFRNAVMLQLTLAPAPESPALSEDPAMLALDQAEAAAAEAAASGIPAGENPPVAAQSADLPADLAALPDAGMPVDLNVPAPAPSDAPAGTAVVDAAPQPAPAPASGADAGAHPVASGADTDALAQAGGADIAPGASESAPDGAAAPKWAEAAAPSAAATSLSASSGAAAELLAARLDRAACDAAGNAVAADPWAIDALYDHGACLARDGQTGRAQEVFERLSAFDPASARAMVALGVLRQDSGDVRAAQDYYSRAMATSPEDGVAILIRMLEEL